MQLYLTIFAATVLLELPLWLGALVRRGGWGRALGVAVGMNAVTHPIVYWVFPLLIGRYWAMVGAAELFAVAAEGGIVWLAMRGAARPVTLAWATGVSLGANVWSAGVGLVAYRVLWGPLPGW